MPTKSTKKNKNNLRASVPQWEKIYFRFLKFSLKASLSQRLYKLLFFVFMVWQVYRSFSITSKMLAPHFKAQIMNNTRQAEALSLNTRLLKYQNIQKNYQCLSVLICGWKRLTRVNWRVTSAGRFAFLFSFSVLQLFG